MSKVQLSEHDIDNITIRFTGDSGDGMQLVGTLFSETSALIGNDISTFPDYPSEIRAPQGTVSGVSGFQVHFGKKKINTPGDYADVLIAMNPAALKANLKWAKQGATIIVDADTFSEKNLAKAEYNSNPLEDLSLASYNVIPAPITSQTQAVLEDSGLDNKSILRCKNMFALGITYCIFHRPLDFTNAFFEKKFAKYPELVEANKRVLREGYIFAENTHALGSIHIFPANIEKGLYRNMNGNAATAWGLMAGAEKSGLPLFLGSYPITPASEILHELSQYKNLKVRTFQAEDEIAGICTAIGASYAGSMAVTTTSGPGLALKGEAIGLAVMMELPLVIVNVQRGGPSTGLPTKTEQSDLMQALYGRNGEAPCIVLAASTPANCFDYAFIAAKMALEHMTPVILLTDGFLANGSSPWKIVKMEDLPSITHRQITKKTSEYTAFERTDESLARNWVIPGTPELMHRIGSLEKDYVTGQASHVPENHQKMVDLRQEKVERSVSSVPDLEIVGEDSGDVLVVGWGGTYGHLVSAVDELIEDGKKVSLAHFNYINPLPENTADIFSKFKTILVCELNKGQFADFLRIKLQDFDYKQYNKVQGLPFTVEEIIEACEQYL
ncbi:MAG: 2-oxoacid:acceptor oxidoreductase subunit alpha [Bacteroidota bacterium]